jgi:clan AA aspartic protease (TIGR02281 family)
MLTLYTVVTLSYPPNHNRLSVVLRKGLMVCWKRTGLYTGLVLSLLSTPVYAKIFKWTDHAGKLHFSDNISAVPPEYREQVEQRASKTPPSQPAPQMSSFREPETGGPGQRYAVPLHRTGNAMLVDVILDGFLRTRLLVDTGATLTVISKDLARRLSLNLDQAAVVPLQSASGRFLAPLKKLRAVEVGGAVVREVDVVVHDIGTKGVNGLLGMSFLDQFQVTMDTAAGVMVLTTAAGRQGEELYGGYPESWWRRKFRFYRQQIAQIKGYLATRSSDEFVRTLRYFQDELADLDHKASLASVPRNWRY